MINYAKVDAIHQSRDAEEKHFSGVYQVTMTREPAEQKQPSIFKDPQFELPGIELPSIQDRVVIAGVDTFLKYAEAVGLGAVVAEEEIARVQGRAFRRILRESVSPLYVGATAIGIILLAAGIWQTVWMVAVTGGGIIATVVAAVWEAYHRGKSS